MAPIERGYYGVYPVAERWEVGKSGNRESPGARGGMFDGLRHRTLGVAAAVVVASGLLLAAGCSPFALTSVTTGAETLADGEMPSKFIAVDYSASYAPKLGESFVARAGTIYLVLDLEIENHGYETFNTNPMFWSVVIRGQDYRSEVILAGDDLEATSITDGGSATGRVAFIVPRTAEGAELEIKYTPFLGGVHLITREI